ncbi:MAG: efflux RND transporter periplasmic adaptor subunit [Desulfomonile sp.]
MKLARTIGTMMKNDYLTAGAVIFIGILLGILILVTDRRPSVSSDHGHDQDREVRDVHNQQASSHKGHERDPLETDVNKSDEHGHPDAEHPGHEHGPEAVKEAQGHTSSHDRTSVVGVSHESARMAGIRILEADPARIESVIQLPGEIGLNADLVAHVVPRVSGVVAESLKNLGDTVRKGEVVAVIDSREMAEAKSRYLVFLKREELARTILDRTERLWQKNVTPEQAYLNDRKAWEETKIELMAAGQKVLALGIPEKELEGLIAAGSATLTRYEVHAPFDGVVIKKHMSVGEWVSEKSDILVIADLSTVWVEIIVYVRDLETVRVSQKAFVKADASDLEAVGVVSYIGPLVGEESRTARARVVIPNSDGRWRPGLFVTVKLVEDTVLAPVSVAADAVQTVEGRSVVFVQCGDHFESRPVELGRSDGKHVAVTKGLAQGEKYASANSFILKAELSKTGATCSHSQ